MEYVDGVPIDRYADEHRLTTPIGSGLFLRVVDAVQHAHDRHVVHRDLKPGNVLVTRDGVAEAARLRHRQDPRSRRRRGRRPSPALARPMTPDYASPEQVRGEPVTLATDVLRAGPAALRAAAGTSALPADDVHTPDEIARVVCEQDPERPSIAIARTRSRHTRRWHHRHDHTRHGERHAGRHRPSSCASGCPAPSTTSCSRRCARIRASATRRPGRWPTTCGGYLDDQPVTAAQGALRYRAGRWHARRPPRRGGGAAGGGHRRRDRGGHPGHGAGSGCRRAARARRAASVSGGAAVSQPVGRRRTSWLSTALAEMFATELAGGGQLRVVPAEVVARAEREATSASTGDAAAAATQRCGPAWAPITWWWAPSPSATARPRGRSGSTCRCAAPVTIRSRSARTGTDAELFAVVADAGRACASAWDSRRTSAEAERASRAALPQRVTTTRLYARGLERLRALDAIAAQKLLSQAVEEEPDSPLVHAALASAWTALGYDQRASEAAERAVAASAALNREQRLVVEGQLREAQKDWAAALAVYRTLWGFFSDNAEYGLRLAAAQTGAGSAKDALATVAELRRLPAPQSEDPRVDLVESQAATPSATSRTSWPRPLRRWRAPRRRSRRS